MDFIVMSVEKYNFRTTVLRDLGGVVHIFPNGKITTLSNMTKEWSAYVFDIGVAYKENTDHVIEIPFPHRSLYFGEKSKSFNVQLLDKLQSQEQHQVEPVTQSVRKDVL